MVNNTAAVRTFVRASEEAGIDAQPASGPLRGGSSCPVFYQAAVMHQSLWRNSGVILACYAQAVRRQLV